MKRQRGVDVDIDVRAHLARPERVIGKAAATTNAAQVRLGAGRAVTGLKCSEVLLRYDRTAARMGAFLIHCDAGRVLCLDE